MFRVSAEIYDRFVGRYSPPLARAMCDAARVGAGQRALDVGCGSGALVAALAGVLGAEHVTGLDPSEPFVEAAQARVPGARVVVGSAESLPFGNDEFDAALSQLVVNFLADPELGVREMSRVTRPGGVVAGCVWDYGGGMTMLRAFWEAAASLDPAGATASMEQNTMRFATPEELAALWRTAGLDEVDVSPIDVDAAYHDFEDLWSPFPSGVGPAGAYAASLDDEARDRLREEFARRLGPPPDSPFTLSARAWCAVGRVRGVGPIEAG
ncbi:MAG: class I SAM-dependent methyltransferase [Actinobacteria bacterium]|nr:class I SAM-dependent methyltransferase [Actinomycetota bacterium]